MIRAIVAMDSQRGIATAAGIPWNISADKRYFREKTSNATVIMGAGTAQEFAAPLPQRRNVIVSHHPDAVRAGFEYVTDLAAFLGTASDDVWIIGGAQLYAAALDHCQELYVTQLEGDFGCSKFFPDFAADFALVSESAEQVDNGYHFRFAVYARAT